MKINIPFNFPDDKQDYSDAVFGRNFKTMIQEHIEFLVKLNF